MHCVLRTQGTLDIYCSTNPQQTGGMVYVGLLQQSNPNIFSPVVQLVFGAGMNGQNEGRWGLNTEYGGFRIGNAWNMTSSYSNSFSQYALFIDHRGTTAINHPYPTSNFNPNLSGMPDYTWTKLNVNGYIVSKGHYVNSDRRYKTDVKPVDNFGNLFKLNSVQYKPSSEATKEILELFKATKKDDMPEREFNVIVANYERMIADEDTNNSVHFGFIAQDLQKIFPNLVQEDELGFLSVNYTGLIPVLVDVVKEQQKQINYLLEKEKGKNVEQIDATNDAMLYQNNPNPFSQRTEIKYYIPENSRNAFICIYDMVGKEVMRIDGLGRGFSSVALDGNRLQAGMYMYTLIVDGKEIDTKKMILTNNN